MICGLGWAFAAPAAEARTSFVVTPVLAPSDALLLFTMAEPTLVSVAPSAAACAWVDEPLAWLEEDLAWEAPEPTVSEAWHTDKRGEVVRYDQISRRPDRPEDYEAYRYPVATLPGWPSVSSGYDLDRADADQRRGKMRAIGHGGLDIPQMIGAPIAMVPLAHQVGDAEVFYVGPLFGNTVVTMHAVREGGDTRHYVVLYGHLKEAAPLLARGQKIAAGALVGLVGDSESPEFVHLHLETRRLRDGIDPHRLSPDGVLALTIVSDPRNVLLRRHESSAKACRGRILGARRGTALGTFRLTLDGFAPPEPLGLAWSARERDEREPRADEP